MQQAGLGASEHTVPSILSLGAPENQTQDGRVQGKASVAHRMSIHSGIQGRAGSLWDRARVRELLLRCLSNLCGPAKKQ